MDDQPQTPFPAPPAEPQADTLQAAPPPRKRRRRLLATVASTALVAGAVGVGAGYAAGHGLGGDSTTNASSGTQRTITSSGTGGITQIPSYGWQVPVDPYSGQDPFGSQGQGQTQGQGTSTDSTTQASSTQLTGLVRIVSTMKYAGATAAGTGMVLTSDGEVVTNHHVVEGSTSIKVKVMSTGKTYTATVVGTDAKDDVAVLQLKDASGLSTVKTDTGGAAVGDAVTAVGDANGTVSYLSAASGKVVALNQSITTQSEGTATGERLTGLTEISSDVISGDSGGATYDADGQVVGMTTAASSGGDVVGYAVPIARVLRIVDDLDSGVAGSRYDYTLPAFLGIGLGQATGAAATVQGVYDGAPASQAGIAAGDTITKVDGTPVRTAKQLRAAIAQHSPGDRVTVSWTDTSGGAHTGTVTLATGAVE
jgi:S1-C subfamily serine protease